MLLVMQDRLEKYEVMYISGVGQARKIWSDVISCAGQASKIRSDVISGAEQASKIWSDVY